MESQTIQAKIEKLLRLANGAGTPAEAANAAARAQRLAEQYRIDLATIDPNRPLAAEEPIEEQTIEGGERIAKWRIRLLGHLARVNDCKAFQMIFKGGRDWEKPEEAPRQMRLVGRESDTATVRYMFAMLARQIDRMAKERGRGLGRAWTDDFRLGAVDTIGDRLTKVREEARAEARAGAAANGTGAAVEAALARIDSRGDALAKYFESKGYQFRAAPRGREVGNGYSRGRTAGHGVDIGGGGRAGLGTGQRALGPAR